MEPPDTDPYVWWCERTIYFVLLDYLIRECFLESRWRNGFQSETTEKERMVKEKEKRCDVGLVFCFALYYRFFSLYAGTDALFVLWKFYEL